MKIIVFEGIDKAGKSLQLEMLYNALSEKGYAVEKSGFHRYDTPTGKLIRSFLDGEYEAPQIAIECIMAADKYAQLDWFKELEETTDVLILDRYILSQFIYGKSSGLTIEFLSDLLCHLPEPDFHIYLDISPEDSMARKRDGVTDDLYERNYDLMNDARNNYLKIMNEETKYNRAVILDATLDKDELHKQILKRLESVLSETKEVLA